MYVCMYMTNGHLRGFHTGVFPKSVIAHGQYAHTHMWTQLIHTCKANKHTHTLCLYIHLRTYVLACKYIYRQAMTRTLSLYTYMHNIYIQACSTHLYIHTYTCVQANKDAHALAAQMRFETSTKKGGKDWILTRITSDQTDLHIKKLSLPSGILEKGGTGDQISSICICLRACVCVMYA